MSQIHQVDITEYRQRIVIRMALPDVDIADVYVSIGKHSIRVLAQGKEVWEWNGKNSCVVNNANYYRLIPLPQYYDVRTANATFTDEVLEIIIPRMKKEHA